MHNYSYPAGLLRDPALWASEGKQNSSHLSTSPTYCISEWLPRICLIRTVNLLAEITKYTAKPRWKGLLNTIWFLLQSWSWPNVASPSSSPYNNSAAPVVFSHQIPPHTFRSIRIFIPTVSFSYPLGSQQLPLGLTLSYGSFPQTSLPSPVSAEDTEFWGWASILPSLDKRKTILLWGQHLLCLYFLSFWGWSSGPRRSQFIHLPSLSLGTNHVLGAEDAGLEWQGPCFFGAYICFRTTRVGNCVFTTYCP